MDDQGQVTTALWGSPKDAIDLLWAADIKGYDAVDYLLNRLRLRLVEAKAALAVAQTDDGVNRHVDELIPCGLWSVEPALTIHSPFWKTSDVTIERRGYDEQRDRVLGPVQLVGVVFDLAALKVGLPLKIDSDINDPQPSLPVPDPDPEILKRGRGRPKGAYTYPDDILIVKLVIRLLDEGAYTGESRLRHAIQSLLHVIEPINARKTAFDLQGDEPKIRRVAGKVVIERPEFGFNN